MSDARMARWRGMGLLLQTLVCWTLLEHCYGGPRPNQRWEPARHPRHPHRTQNPARHDQRRIEDQPVNDDGDQWLRYPSLYDRGQKVVYPSLNDNDGSGHIQVTHTKSLWLLSLVWKPSFTLSECKKDVCEQWC